MMKSSRYRLETALAGGDAIAMADAVDARIKAFILAHVARERGIDPDVVFVDGDHSPSKTSLREIIDGVRVNAKGRLPLGGVGADHDVDENIIALCDVLDEMLKSSPVGPVGDASTRVALERASEGAVAEDGGEPVGYVFRPSDCSFCGASLASCTCSEGITDRGAAAREMVLLTCRASELAAYVACERSPDDRREAALREDARRRK